jgi:endonuclease YncB( thermonuclease family)
MMRLASLLLVLILLPLPALGAPADAGTPPSGATPATLVKVIDGDTLDVAIAGKVERVRYVGVDTPERSQPGFEAATEANRPLLGAGPLYLVRDVSDRDKTSDHRLLRYVYTSDGTLVERVLVARGFAQPVEYPPDTKFAKEFRQLAVQAAQKKLGFWSSTPLADGAMPYGLTTGAAKVRKGPGTGFAVNASLTKDTPLTVYGRTPAGDWLQVRTPARAGGWISAGLVRLNVAVQQVPVPAYIPVAAAAPEKKAPAGVVPAAPKAAPAIAAPAGNCDPSYPEVCIPAPPPDLDCKDVPYRRFKVIGADPHRFDGDHDGIGCEG